MQREDSSPQSLPNNASDNPHVVIRSDSDKPSGRSAWLCRLFATCAILVPIGMSLSAYALPVPLTAVPQQDKPSLRFREYLLPLGEIVEGFQTKGVFHFQNHGGTPLEITAVKPSCGCLSPELPKKKFAPGETGTLLVLPQTTSQDMGSDDNIKEYFIDVTYREEGAEHTARVFVKYLLPPRRVVVDPKGLWIMQNSAEQTNHTVTVTDQRQPPASIRSVTCPDKRIDIQLEKSKSSQAQLRAEIEVQIPSARDGDLATYLTIEFDDPTTPPVRVPIIVKKIDHGNVSRWIQQSPNSVSIK